MPAAQQRNSVFDFLYHDARRITSFLAQFEEYGSPTQVKAAETASNSAQSSGVIAGEGGVPGFAKGGVTTSIQETSGTSDSAEWTYDPFWRNAVRLLDYLAEHGLIQDDLTKASFGQFVTISGEVTLFDLSIVGRTWRKPSVIAAIQSGIVEKSSVEQAQLNRHDRRKAEAGSRNRSDRIKRPSEIDMLLDMMDVLPHSVQAYIQSHDGTVAWSTLKEDALVVSSSDLLLKHGAAINGRWTLLGLLDAKPEAPLQADITAQRLLKLGIAVDEGRGVAAGLMALLAPITMRFLGRSDVAYGVTPLAIFRETSA